MSGARGGSPGRQLKAELLFAIWKEGDSLGDEPRAVSAALGVWLSRELGTAGCACISCSAEEALFCPRSLPAKC